MDNYKVTITRAYSQKYGEYNKEWASCSYTVELPANTSVEEQRQASKVLHERAKADVQDGIFVGNEAETIEQESYNGFVGTNKKLDHKVYHSNE